MKQNTNADEAEFECKHCGEEHDELEATECEESPTGFCSLQHKDPNNAETPEDNTMNSTDTAEDENDDWKTMSSEECKKEAGLTQVNGLVWEQTDN